MYKQKPFNHCPFIADAIERMENIIEMYLYEFEKTWDDDDEIEAEQIQIPEFWGYIKNALIESGHYIND